MRKMITLTLFLLLAVWAVAQDTTPGAAPATSQSQTQSQPATPGQSSTTATPDQSQTPATSAKPDQSQSQTPGASDQSAQGMANAQVIEGCLGGKDPNYTVTAKDGTVYNLIVPEGADISTLAKHTGESVAVMGSVDTSTSSSSATTGSVAGSSNTTSSSSTNKALHAMRIRKGTGTCPANGTSNPSSTTPPSPKQ